MEIGWLWLALIVAWIVNLLLFGWLLRLRMEVWANRRVIAALEAAAHQPDQKGHSKRTNGVGLAFLFVVFGQILLLLRETWR